MIRGIYNRNVVVTRITASLLDPAGVTPSLVPDYQPSEEGVYVDVAVAGAGSPGVIRLVGAGPGGSITEEIEVAGDGYSPLSRERYNSLSLIEVVSGITVGTISAVQSRAQGERIGREVVVARIKASVRAKSGYIRALYAGFTESAEYVLAAKDNEKLHNPIPSFIYVDFENRVLKFRPTFVTPPGRRGNVNVDLKLVGTETAMPSGGK